MQVWRSERGEVRRTLLTAFCFCFVLSCLSPSTCLCRVTVVVLYSYREDYHKVLLWASFSKESLPWTEVSFSQLSFFLYLLFLLFVGVYFWYSDWLESNRSPTKRSNAKDKGRDDGVVMKVSVMDRIAQASVINNNALNGTGGVTTLPGSCLTYTGQPWILEWLMYVALYCTWQCIIYRQKIIMKWSKNFIKCHIFPYCSVSLLKQLHQMCLKW